MSQVMPENSWAGAGMMAMVLDAPLQKDVGCLVSIESMIQEINKYVHVICIYIYMYIV